jgi:hypothetical protein
MMNLTSRALAFSSLALTFGLLGCGNKLLGVAPSISVSPGTLAFPETTVGTSTSVTINVTNEGSAALAITGIKVASNPNNDLAIAALLTTDCSGNSRSGSTTLAPADCAQFVVNWSPTAVHMAQGTVQIDSSDTSNPTVTLSASGNSVANTCQCTSGQSCCDNTCVESQTDVTHCGGCNPCASGDTCVGGACIPPVSNPPDAGPTSCSQNSQCSGANALCCNHACITDTTGTGLCPCTGTGSTSTFNVGTLIIPMDECWQRGMDTATLPSYCNAKNAKATKDDAPLKAYGLVFFLLKHGVTVYVVIDPAKSKIDGKDLTLSNPFEVAPPVKKYNWATGDADALADATQQYVDYRGGPFLIDASQHDKVVQLLKSDADFAQFRQANTITVHVATVGFQSVVAKSLNVVPSRVALLLPPSNADYAKILINYLDSAGLNFSGAGGTSSSPGAIYDVLSESDFLPDYDHSKLKANGYKLLWSPHWSGASDATTNSKQLATIASYVNEGGDLFAECAAIGTLEGESMGGSVAGGSPGTRFMTTTGTVINSLNPTNTNGTIGAPFTYAGLANVLLQIGDFPFFGVDGVITDFRPVGSYNTNVTKLISKTESGNVSQLFTALDQKAAHKGSVVYLSGHDYSYAGSNHGVAGLTAGSRVVLNTLFSLGANNVCTSN